MLSAVKVYFKLAWAYKTPLIFMLDCRYETTTIKRLGMFCNDMPDLTYIPELRDCDNFGFIYKGITDRQTNAVGLVIGRVPAGLHCWNVALTDDGPYQVEPQTGWIFKKLKGYRPLVIII